VDLTDDLSVRRGVLVIGECPARARARGGVVLEGCARKRVGDHPPRDV